MLEARRKYFLIADSILSDIDVATSSQGFGRVKAYKKSRKNIIKKLKDLKKIYETLYGDIEGRSKLFRDGLDECQKFENELKILLEDALNNPTVNEKDMETLKKRGDTLSGKISREKSYYMDQLEEINNNIPAYKEFTVKIDKICGLLNKAHYEHEYKRVLPVILELFRRCLCNFSFTK